MPVDPPPSQLEGRFTRALNRLLVKLKVDEVPHIKRIIVTIAGVMVITFGVVLIVTPGPAILVIPMGLAILGTEYAWARRWLRNGRKIARKALSRTQKIIGVGSSSGGSKSPRKEKVAATPVTDNKPSASQIPAAESGDEQPEALAGASGGGLDDTTVCR